MQHVIIQKGFVIISIFFFIFHLCDREVSDHQDLQDPLEQEEER